MTLGSRVRTVNKTKILALENLTYNDDMQTVESEQNKQTKGTVCYILLNAMGKIGVGKKVFGEKEQQG